MFKLKKANAKREYVLLGPKAPFEVVEAYKELRTNLIFVLGARNSKVALFTSALMMEGKTNTSANVAITFAQMGARVLVIDADMRKPRLHRLFKCQLATGLSEALCGVIEDSSIQKTQYDNLFVMTAGRIPPNPADLLYSPNMDTLLETVQGTFDYIFIDAPPVGVVTDAAIIAGKIGGAIMVVRNGQSHVDNINAARDALSAAGSGVIGYVLTDADNRNKGYTNNYHGYGSAYYASQEQ